MKKKQTGLILAFLILGIMLTGFQVQCLEVEELPRCYNGVDDDGDGNTDDADLECNYPSSATGHIEYCPWWNNEGVSVDELSCDNAKQQFINTHGTDDISQLKCSSVSGLNAFFDFYTSGPEESPEEEPEEPEGGEEFIP